MIKRLSKFLLVLVLITGWIFSGWPGIQTAEAVSAETFTTSTTWTAPTGVTSVTAEVWGGGGGGGGMNASTDGGGGGGGAYSQQVVTVVPGNNDTVTVGPEPAMRDAPLQRRAETAGLAQPALFCKRGSRRLFNGNAASRRRRRRGVFRRWNYKIQRRSGREREEQYHRPRRLRRFFRRHRRKWMERSPNMEHRDLSDCEHSNGRRTWRQWRQRQRRGRFYSCCRSVRRWWRRRGGRHKYLRRKWRRWQGGSYLYSSSCGFNLGDRSGGF